MVKSTLALAVSAAAMIATSASAQVTGVSSPSGPLPGSAFTTFDNRTLGSTAQTTNTGISVAFTGTGAFVQGTTTGVNVAPYVVGTSGTSFGQATGPDATVYVTSGIGTASLTFASAQQYLGLLWSSIDVYNTLTFNFLGGGSQAFTGSQALALGNGTNGTEYINFTSTTPFTSVVAGSTSNALEFDNVALKAVAATPEPATWVMMIVGFGAVGFGLRRRQKVATQVSDAG